MPAVEVPEQLYRRLQAAAESEDIETQLWRLVYESKQWAE
jgi:hypothetical protein